MSGGLAMVDPSTAAFCKSAVADMRPWLCCCGWFWSIEPYKELTASDIELLLSSSSFTHWGNSKTDGPDPNKEVLGDPKILIGTVGTNSGRSPPKIEAKNALADVPANPQLLRWGLPNSGPSILKLSGIVATDWGGASVGSFLKFEELNFVLSSARASQKALWVMKLSFLYHDAWSHNKKPSQFNSV